VSGTFTQASPFIGSMIVVEFSASFQTPLT